MKTAEQWQEELASETSAQSIRMIQRDAMITCAGLLREESNSEGVHRIADKILRRAFDLLKEQS